LESEDGFCAYLYTKNLKQKKELLCAIAYDPTPIFLLGTMSYRSQQTHENLFA
jgi:hypothetical protein